MPQSLNLTPKAAHHVKSGHGLHVHNIKGESSITRLASQPPSDRDGPRVNRSITARNVRLINDKGDMVGVVPIREALFAAEQAGLDLVEISPQADPPVCKILNYGKYRYAEQKKAAEARKKQKVVDLKEIKLRPGIEEHDFQVKMRSAQRFFEEGDKVKFTVKFRGRELNNQEFGMNLLNRVKDALAPFSKVELFPKMEGRQMIMVLVAK